MPDISEDWILEQLDSKEPDIPALMDAIDSTAQAGRARDALSWLQLLEETAVARNDHRTALDAMRRRAAISQDGHGKNPEYLKSATELLKHDRNMRRMIEDAGFDKKLEPAECLRRLLTLLDLEPNTICYDSTWGQGLVKKIDMFYHRVKIDFEKKHGHELSLAYAGETLQLLEPGHLLAICHTDPERISEMVENDQAGLVKLTIESMGSMTATALQDELVPRIIPEENWKKFWEAARKGLKQDPLFDLPPKRKEPMRLLQDESELYGLIWFKDIKDLRSVPELVEKLELCLQSLEEAPQEDAILDIVADRLDFVIVGSLGNNPAMAARALLLADAFGIEGGRLNRENSYDRFLERDCLVRTTDALVSKYLKPFVSNLLRHDETAAHKVIGQLPDFSLTVLGEMLSLLISEGYQDDVSRVFQTAIKRREINTKMLLWIMRNDKYLSEWRIGSMTDLVPMVFRLLENEQSGEDTSDYKRLRNHCESDKWVECVFAEMSPLQRKEFTTRVMQSGAWASLDRKSMLARIIRVDPNMQEVVTPSRAKADRQTNIGAKTTSKRSYQERMRQLEKLVNTDIPENSREIAEARSHGDLRENAEFKAAKERQGLLMQRQGEMELQLNTVTPTDYADAQTDVAGPGTMVTIRYSSGESSEYTLLGEWDRDEGLNIISSKSRLAEMLRGHKQGERLNIPSEDGEVEVTITHIGELSAKVREWINA